MNSFQIIILSFFMSITFMSVSAQNNDSIKINNFSIEKECSRGFCEFEISFDDCSRHYKSK